VAISPESKMRSPDRILVLSVMDGKKPISTTGAADPRLFSGENKLHAVMDPASGLWRFKYDMGIVPEPLKCSFTSFTALKKFAEAYYYKRNIEITEVKD
jgi:hypothetical protein